MPTSYPWAGAHIAHTEDGQLLSELLRAKHWQTPEWLERWFEQNGEEDLVELLGYQLDLEPTGGDDE